MNPLELIQKIHEPIFRDIIAECTIQIFDYSDNRKIKLEGSAVLLRHLDKYFLISAAHVFDSFQSFCGIQLDKESLAPPGGKLYLSQNKYMTKDERKKDKIDVGIMRLSEESAKKISLVYKSITIEDIEISEKQTKTDRYIIFGYPSTNKHVRIHQGTGSIKCLPFIYYTDRSNVDYASLGYSKKKHILLNIDSNNIGETSHNNKIQLERLEGISGCGVWKTGVIKIGNNVYPKLKLVGIVHFHHKQKESEFIVATRIDYLTEFMRTQLEVEVPTSTHVGFKAIREAFLI